MSWRGRRIVCLPNCVFLSETSRQIAIYKAMIASGMDAVLATHGGPYDFVFEQEGVPCTQLNPPMTKPEADRRLAGVFNLAMRPQLPAVLGEHVVNALVTVERILGEPSYRAAAGRLQRLQGARNGPLEVARAVRQLLA